jgi:hypothetical protein
MAWQGRLRAVALVVLACAGCANSVGMPPSEPEYPALRLPARMPDPAPPAPAPTPAQPEPEALPSKADAPNAPANETAETAAGAARRAGPPAQGYLPDPPALSERAQWVYDVEYDRGAVTIKPPAPLCLRRPAASARRIGRFAFELWLGRELIERVRFEFPLLAAEAPEDESRQPVRRAPSFARGARVSARLQIPASPRATSARVLDRATGETWDVEWPPRSSTGEATAPCPVVAPAAEPAAAPHA